MADGAVNFLLDKLTTILLQNATLLGDAQNEIEEIKFELESMRAFLRDAERSRGKSESVEAWVRQVREVAYEVENLVDEFMHHRNREKHKSAVKNLINGVTKFPRRIISTHRLASKLQKLKAKVLEISERSKRYDFDRVDDYGKKLSRNKSQHYYRESHTFYEEDEIVGMEKSVEQLFRWLMQGEPRRTIISIVGMGGLGKTTLVSRVFNNQIIKRHFDCWAWISVSPTYGVSEILRNIIKEVFGETQTTIPNNLGSMDYRRLVGLLIDYLHQRRYIIVLDDVWSIDFWSEIRSAFPNNRYGSRIILTTRNENVAASVGVGSRIHKLKPLQEEDALTLFCKRAFWDDPGHCCPSELKPLTHAILKKCQGLPLAIVAVGGLMYSRSKTVVEWKKVYDSMNWQLSNHPLLGQMKSILLLSFDDLPFSLKHCFLYCCLFHDGYLIKRKKLIRLWVAEGFVTEREGMTMEEVAEDYLRELILRSMIQVTETNDAGRVKTCRMHDVMRELAKTASEKDDFCITCHGHEPKLKRKIRHLSLYNRGENIRLSGTMSRHLRSFLVFSAERRIPFSMNILLPKFRLLRVLDLQGVPIETIPTALVDLFNLRYLNLRRTRIRALPKSIGRLCNLQTMDVRSTAVAKLPNGITKLQNLRHLYMTHEPDQTPLRHDTPQGTQIPAGISNLQSLQTLAYIEAEKGLLKQLRSLTKLKRLEITNLKASDGPKLCASLEKLTGIYRLGLAACSDEELNIEDLTQPPLFLQKLTLVGRLKQLPHWLSSLENLTHLHLGLSCLNEDSLGSLHLLASLVFLELNRAYDGKCLHFKKGWFPRLNKTRIVELEHLDSLIIDEGAFPSLQELHLVRCAELKELPQGIEYLTSLQKLHTEEMSGEFVQTVRVAFSEDQGKKKDLITFMSQALQRRGKKQPCSDCLATAQ